MAIREAKDLPGGRNSDETVTRAIEMLIQANGLHKLITQRFSAGGAADWLGTPKLSLSGRTPAELVLEGKFAEAGLAIDAV